MTDPHHGSFAKRLDAALTEKGIPLDRISRKLEAQSLKCSPSTLSLWRNGRTRPRRHQSFLIVEALERLLDLPAGHLVDAEHEVSAGHAGWWENAGSGWEVHYHGEEIAHAHDEFGIDVDDGLRRHSIFEVIRFDEERRFLGTTCTLVLEAARDGVERLVISSFGGLDEDCEESLGMRFAKARTGSGWDGAACTRRRARSSPN